MHVVRSETVMGAMQTIPIPDRAQVRDEPVITRAQRAHWRLSWEQRLVRNARPSTAPPLTLTLHGLPATFAHRYGFALLDAASPLIGEASIFSLTNDVLPYRSLFIYVHLFNRRFPLFLHPHQRFFLLCPAISLRSRGHHKAAPGERLVASIGRLFRTPALA
jgi:hypothetical protein